MGYKVGGGGFSGRSKSCGFWWWKKTCAWFETGIVHGSYDEWFQNYPLDPYPTRQLKCATCGKLIWW